MKTISKLFSIITAVIFLTSCADKGSIKEQSSDAVPESSSESSSAESGETSENNLIPITEIRENWAASVNEIRSGNYDNINFQNALFSFTDANEVHELKLQKTSFFYTPDEAFENLSRRMDELFPDKFSDEEKAREIRFATLEKYNDAEFPYSFPSLSQLKESGEEESTTTVFADAKNCFVSTWNGGLSKFNKGELAKRSGFVGSMDSFRADEAFPCIFYTEDVDCEEVFHLESGDISVAEAVKSANKYLSQLEYAAREFPFTTRVKSVFVMDIGEGLNAFYFLIDPQYEGLIFESVKPSDTPAAACSYVSDDTNEIRIFGAAVMMKKDDLDFFRINLPYEHDITENIAFSSIISPKTAADIASNKLTSGTSFSAESVSFVYKEISKMPQGGYNNGLERNARDIDLKPCYRFVLKPKADGIEKLYIVLIDAKTGDFYSYVLLT